MALLAEGGATQVEPGHGLTGTTPLHAAASISIPCSSPPGRARPRPDRNHAASRGRLYIDPVFQPYRVTALVGRDPEAALAREIEASIPEPAMIDYYGQLRLESGHHVAVGDTVIFGFRARTFVTRAFIVPVAGVAAGEPSVEGVWTTDGCEAPWEG